MEEFVSTEISGISFKKHCTSFSPPIQPNEIVFRNQNSIFVCLPSTLFILFLREETNVSTRNSLRDRHFLAVTKSLFFFFLLQLQLLRTHEPRSSVHQRKFLLVIFGYLDCSLILAPDQALR